METLDTVQQHHTQLSSEAVFLKKEIDFLLKILKNCYSTSVSDERIKLLDSFWKNFDRHLSDLDQLVSHIALQENKYSMRHKNHPVNSIIPDNKEETFKLKMNFIQIEIKLLKESFYEFMHGCNACVFKTNQ